MTINETALFIQDKALSLRYEAQKFRQTTPVAVAWLERAAAWALRHGFQELAGNLCRQIGQMEA